MTHKKRLLPSTRLLVSTTILVLLSCNKILDYLPGGDTRSICRIVKFTSTSNNPQKTGKIYYNRYGNPDSVIFDADMTGQFNYLFFYDSKQRLTDCMAYTPTNIDTIREGQSTEPNDLILTQQWHKYYYDNKDRVVKDSVFSEAIYKPGNMTPIEWRYPYGPLTESFMTQIFSYDSKDRIVKNIYRFLDNTSIKTYEYGPDGNLQVPGRSYDKKLSYLRTHKIWMLLALDYSVNNPFPAVAYNKYGLPTKFDLNLPNPSFHEFLITNLDRSTFTYDCD